MAGRVWDRIKELERKRGAIEKATSLVEEAGLEVHGNLPPLWHEARQLLEMPEYRNNSVVQRLRSGEALESIVKDTVSQRRFSLRLPWNHQERENFNKKVNELEGVIPCPGLEIYSLGRGPAEGVALMYAVGGALISLMGYNIETSPIQNTPELSIIPIAFLGSIGALLGHQFLGYSNQTRKWIRENVGYFNKELGL